MLGGAGSGLRAACGGQGLLEDSLFETCSIPHQRCWMVFLRAGVLLWRSGGLVEWLGLPTGVKYLFAPCIFLPAFVFNQPLIAGPPREGWARCIAATDLGSFSSSRTASGLSWLAGRGKHE